MGNWVELAEQLAHSDGFWIDCTVKHLRVVGEPFFEQSGHYFSQRMEDLGLTTKGHPHKHET